MIELLRSLDEARVAYDARSLGDGVTLMPSMFAEGSYAELERCLTLMRDGGEDILLDPVTGSPTFGDHGFAVSIMRPPQRRLWWHVCSRYRWGDQRALLVTVKRNQLGYRFEMPPCTEWVAGGASAGSNKALVRAYCWSPYVRKELAAEGLRQLVSLMHGGRADRILLPRLLFRRKLGLPVEGDVIADEAVAV